jgi:hypothetical protein
MIPERPTVQGKPKTQGLSEASKFPAGANRHKSITISNDCPPQNQPLDLLLLTSVHFA